MLRGLILLFICDVFASLLNSIFLSIEEIIMQSLFLVWIGRNIQRGILCASLL